MLTRLTSWDEFSSTRAGPGTPSSSIEGIHNGIHGRVGAGGHMANNELAGRLLLCYITNSSDTCFNAAFDPIFFLHHANVDRMISLWSALNPGVWVTPGDSADGTATIPENTVIDTNTRILIHIVSAV